MSTRTNERRAARGQLPKHAVRLAVQRATTGARRAALASLAGQGRAARQSGAQAAARCAEFQRTLDDVADVVERVQQEAAGKFTGIREGLEATIAAEIAAAEAARVAAAVKTLSPKMRETMLGRTEDYSGTQWWPRYAPAGTMAALVTRGLVEAKQYPGQTGRRFTQLGLAVSAALRAEQQA